MRIVRDYSFVAPEDRGASAAIGNFDGVHLGHQSVIDMARTQQAGAGSWHLRNFIKAAKAFVSGRREGNSKRS